MKRFLAAAVGLVALGIAGQVSAADLPPAVPYTRAPMIPALYDWSGFYTGLNGGWGRSNNCWTDANAAPALPDGCHNASGGFGGGQIGYRLQSGGFVFGAEVQGDWAGLSGSSVSQVNPAQTNNTHIDSFGLLTGQVGYAVNTALLYVKGGGAVIGDRFSITPTGAGGPVIATSATQSRWGGTVGAGVEFSFAPDWSVAVEYDHLFLQDRLNTMLTPAGTFVVNEPVHQSADLVSLRVNYRWGGPVIAKY